ncbi:MAG: hypothetical protein AB3N06_06680 [Erythrobacter sp.]
MELLPLKYAASTVTKYHVIVILLACALPLVTGTSNRISRDFAQILITALAFVLIYAWAAPIIGQIYGDKFSWSQAWPSGFVLAFAFMVWGCLSFWTQGAGGNGLAIAASFFLTLGTVFFGSFFSATYWLLPRAVGWGVVEFSRKAWGVSL